MCASTRKVKPIWILLKQETVSGKFAPRSRLITMPAPHHSFLQAGCPSCRPSNSVKALMENYFTQQKHMKWDEDPSFGLRASSLTEWTCLPFRSVVLTSSQSSPKIWHIRIAQHDHSASLSAVNRDILQFLDRLCYDP